MDEPFRHTRTLLNAFRRTHTVSIASSIQHTAKYFSLFWFMYELEYKTRILTKLHAEVNRILVNVGKV